MTEIDRDHIIDFDLHGIVGIRLLNPTEGDTKAVINQLGPPSAPLINDPDITVRFVSKLPTKRLNLLALTAGYDDRGFYILRSSKTSCITRIPFEQLGSPCEVVCQSGMRSIPLLIAMVNLAFLGKDYLPLHASAFHYHDVCSAVMGWAKGGKTEAMLAFAQHGASYVADEWTIFAPGGEEVFGIPEPIRLWDWHLAQVPALRQTVQGKKKWVFRGIHAAEALHSMLCQVGLKNVFPVTLLGEALPAFKRQLNIQLHPNRIFENRVIPRAVPENIFLIGSHAHPEITVQPCDPGEVAQRMLSSNLFELFPLLEHYRAFRFAFPKLQNPLIENIQTLQQRLIGQLFHQKSCYRVMHPYPVAFETLYEAMQPFTKKPEVHIASPNKV